MSACVNLYSTVCQENGLIWRPGVAESNGSLLPGQVGGVAQR